MYSGWVPEITKWDADFTFLSNMIDIIEENSSLWMRAWRLHIALGYFKAVRKFGSGPKVRDQTG
jgi:hypothetical protein